MQNPATLLLRIGLAFVFFYAAVSSFFEPLNWIGFFPQFLRGLIPQNLLLSGFSLFEVGMGLWLLSGKKAFAAAFISAVSLLGIVLFNLGSLDIMFRDIGLFFAALALLFLSR
ncbi:MAG: hypothetical protein A2842_01310 [Candidatus Wildermuthbacteria bacterium RIFCSPHIGHO2_01_FULL_48_25]|uniref:DoxX family protein n=1 Tax=Candidatus Wildermuthbacteria bacterium RIFCSPLOWO2_01_FULL_48_16 TaxID=1802461 RepID=A0A1G2RLG7_9BACT|nr:MAG: hypothetical protein A2842_01310 [Candidatus Wildermuthbacteria bacterium RIFCSPHIGHO2_01_FULL_48_25]OHA73676.1 MAG: hypothetical protein A3B24_02015 [Candidatus Wildermuthbacteria bacterium RIFCSPLOWO2_01_FULL_48_16]